jgi:hypothetical protein
MITPDAEILFTETYDLKGNSEQIICKWEGPKGGILGISSKLIEHARDDIFQASRPLQIGTLVRIGPYRLRIFGRSEEWDYDTWYLVRHDSVLGNLRAVVYRATRWFDLVYRRLIITAAVWKLADYNPNVIPGWQDLHFTQTVSDWLQLLRKRKDP